MDVALSRAFFITILQNHHISGFLRSNSNQNMSPQIICQCHLCSKYATADPDTGQRVPGLMQYRGVWAAHQKKYLIWCKKNSPNIINAEDVTMDEVEESNLDAEMTEAVLDVTMEADEGRVPDPLLSGSSCYEDLPRTTPYDATHQMASGLEEEMVDPIPKVESM